MGSLSRCDGRGPAVATLASSLGACVCGLRLLLLERRRSSTSPAPAIPASTPPTRAKPDGTIDSSNVTEPGRRLDAADPGHQHLRQLRLDPGDRQGGDLLPGPRLQRAGDRPRIAAKSSGRRPTNSPTRARTASSSPKARSSARRRPKPSRSTRRPASSSGRSTLPRNEHEGIDMAPGLPRRHGLRLDRAGQRRPSPTKAAAPACSGRSTRRPARKSGTSTPCRRDLWGNPKVNSGGGVWYPPAFDEKG